MSDKVELQGPLLEARKLIAQSWFSCERMGGHWFQRDYVLGLFPFGEPYCIRCGKTPSATQEPNRGAA